MYPSYSYICQFKQINWWNQKLSHFYLAILNLGNVEMEQKSYKNIKFGHTQISVPILGIYCQKQPVSTPANYNVVFFEKLEKVLMGVCNVSPIILNKNPCKIFLNNLKNYSSSYTEDNTNDKGDIPYLPCFNKIVMKTKKFYGVVQTNNLVFNVFDDVNHMKLCHFWDMCF